MTFIKQLSSADWQLWRAIRLDALTESPDAFGSTLERELSFSESEWRQRLKANSFMAFIDDKPVGILAGLYSDDDAGGREVVAMWVAPKVRGTDVATDLLKAVKRWATDDGASALSLWVADANSRATRFYQRMGFIDTGKLGVIRPGSDQRARRMRLVLP